MVMISTTVLSFFAVFNIVSGTAFSLAKMDRMRCQVDAGFDVFGNPLNQVQIQVKIDGLDMLDVWVVNPTHFSGFPAVSPMHTNVPSIGGTVSVDWDSAPAPDPITGLIPDGVLIIADDFVANGDKIVAHAKCVTTREEIASMEAGCAWKASAQFRQQTKPTATESAKNATP
ncbi:MAG: hypothetical protein ACE5FY_03645 [Nitrospiria bacterium]